jgi:hypothetical protein
MRVAARMRYTDDCSRCCILCGTFCVLQAAVADSQLTIFVWDGTNDSEGKAALHDLQQQQAQLATSSSADGSSDSSSSSSQDIIMVCTLQSIT